MVFLHGFPEIWYSWRHQMIAVARSGFRAIAPDHRGYGLSEPPPEPEKASFSDLLADLVGILDFLGIDKVLRFISSVWLPRKWKARRGIFALSMELRIVHPSHCDRRFSSLQRILEFGLRISSAFSTGRGS